jgi:hypothetical protein
MHMPHVWPFYKKPKPAPVAVNELNLVNADGSAASFPQYWKRNTLVIDLSGVSGAGNVAARLPEETTWPVRLAVRVRPGSVGQVEIQGEERSVLPVTNEGASTIDLEIVPSAIAHHGAIYISWGPCRICRGGGRSKPDSFRYRAPARRLRPRRAPTIIAPSRHASAFAAPAPDVRCTDGSSSFGRLAVREPPHTQPYRAPAGSGAV